MSKFFKIIGILTCIFGVFAAVKFFKGECAD